jgi:hypothetical protein
MARSRRVAHLGNFYDRDMTTEDGDLETDIVSGSAASSVFHEVIRKDLETLLHMEIPGEAWRQINSVTARYVFDARHYDEAASASDVTDACKDLVQAIDRFTEIVRRYREDLTLEGIVIATELDSTSDTLVTKTREHLKRIMSPQGMTPFLDGNCWDVWIGKLSVVAASINIPPSGEGGGRSRSPSLFVQLVARLQSEMPDDVARHEGSGNKRIESLARAVRRALKGWKDQSGRRSSPPDTFK